MSYRNLIFSISCLFFPMQYVLLPLL